MNVSPNKIHVKDGLTWAEGRRSGVITLPPRLCYCSLFTISHSKAIIYLRLIDVESRARRRLSCYKDKQNRNYEYGGDTTIRNIVLASVPAPAHNWLGGYDTCPLVHKNLVGLKEPS